MRDIFSLLLHLVVITIRAGSARRSPFRCCRIRLDATSSIDPQSWSETRSQPAGFGSDHRRLCTLLMRPARVVRSAVVLKPSTLLRFHRMLTKQKYRLLFSRKQFRPPGPKGPTKELIDAVVEMKRRNRTWGCKRIALQITLALGSTL